jgi:hypothetical protein
MHRLRPTKPEFLGCLVHCILRKTHKLLNIADRTLNIHGWHMKAKRGQLNGDHILGVGNVLPKLLNVQRTSEHPKHMTMRRGG